MHLLAAKSGTIDDGLEPFDLSQTPADLLFISSADSELTAISEAITETNHQTSVRLASLNHLQHPMSVDLHLEKTVSKCKLVIIRVLGGLGYWQYGVEQYSSVLRENNIPIAFLPGDDKPDPELRGLSTLNDTDYDQLWGYLVEGGLENTGNFLKYTNSILKGNTHPPSPKPVLKAGVYWPGEGITTPKEVHKHWKPDQHVVPIVFYRALIQGVGLNPVNRLVKALLKDNLNPLPIFVASLKDPLCQATIETIFDQHPPTVILNSTAFSVNSLNSDHVRPVNPLTSVSANKAPVFQVIFSSSTEEVWESELNGLSGRDIAMNVALPEVDGRILSRAVSFKGESFYDEMTECSITTYRARGDRITFVSSLAKNWCALRQVQNEHSRPAFIMANYPNRDGRLANGVGLDTPESLITVSKELAKHGYKLDNFPKSSADLMKKLTSGPTNWLPDRVKRLGGEFYPLDNYIHEYKKLPYEFRSKIESRWGSPENDPFIKFSSKKLHKKKIKGFALSIHRFDNVIVGLQPARGYNIDAKETYHSPDLMPPHNYIAFYFWIRFEFKAHAIVHMGKHGNLEWLPGKSLALSNSCAPEAILGPTPHIYPFIVNDPGEGTQAKRRSQAVIIDHLTPPMARAETYGPLRELEGLIDEYYEAHSIDQRRATILQKEILSLTGSSGLSDDIGLLGDGDENDLAKLDSYLCDLKEAQIRDGLHIFGLSPSGSLARDLIISLTRLPRNDGREGDASLTQAIANDLNLNMNTLDANMAQSWEGPFPRELEDIIEDKWRSFGDTIERVEIFAQKLLEGEVKSPGSQTNHVLDKINIEVHPTVSKCGESEILGIINALNGEFIQPGPSGAPTRGRLDVLPTGRNFYSVDSRAMPTITAWNIGWKSANLLLEKHLQDNGDWLRTILLSAWGTSNMRTGGDDIAQCLALMGAKPKWDDMSKRVTGFEILPLSVLGRPRVDVTLRISGFFRDAFPQLISLVDSAATAIMNLDEPVEQNLAAARFKSGEDRTRVYGAKPGAYGAGLQALIDERIWNSKSDLGAAYIEWGSYAYGKDSNGKKKTEDFETRLKQTEAIVQNQDNREHDILDSDDYYQFEGGAAAAVSTLQGIDRPIYHNDHSRPERPIIRTLEEEISRVVRSRVVNPKWINGVKRHGYKGAFEMAATLDYLFAFSATTGAVKSHHFDLTYEAYLEDVETFNFIKDNNQSALFEMAQKFKEALDRGLWRPKSNSARALLEKLILK
ncbi:MAG: cobaltochelatase subunit CobN [Paracoccaceae bacterium]|nr:cobaltochelatase subunit CobN [Paracoccaceae bacterium]